MEKKAVLTGYAIVVEDRGFVYVGNVTSDSEWCVITDAQNIRYWGTTNGLGQLQLNGPTEKTKLDACGTVRIPHHALISILDTEASKWQRKN
jgi:hypothetical protein